MSAPIDEKYAELVQAEFPFGDTVEGKGSVRTASDASSTLKTGLFIGRLKPERI